MAFIYQADVWCDGCGRAIKKRIKRDGLAPADPRDEWSYDSDEYPKHADDDEESDCPQHCAAGADCLNYEETSDGERYGYFFRNRLTTDGYEYVREAVAEDRAAGRLDSPAVELWAPEYLND